jgi:CelD/BcsL family acetyltransferase involved in cellulose biosynthesis
VNNPLRCRLVRAAAEIDALGADWERLHRAQPIRHVFQGLAWHRAILDSHAGLRSPCIVVAADESRSVGILPLAVERGRLKFLAAPYADYNDLLCEPSRAGEVLAAMVAGLDAAGLGEAVLDNVREDGLLRRATQAAPAALASRLRWSAGVACPTTLLEEGGAAVVAGILRKQSLRRHQRQLAKQGALGFRHVDSPEEARALLPEFFAQHVARRTEAGGEVRLAKPETRRLYEALLERLGLETVRFSVLELSGAPIAFHFGFEYDRRLVWYKASFSLEHRRSAPGEVLLGKLFEYARDKGLVELDFTRGAEEFKARFANARRQNYSLRVLPAGLTGTLRRIELFAKAGIKRMGRRRREA